MLDIYTNVIAIPAGYKLIRDNEVFALLEPLADTKIIREIIKEIELGEYLDNSYFTSRYGEKLPKMVLSTSSKTLINIYNNIENNYVFNCSELGQNAIEFLLLHSDGKVFLNNPLLMDMPEWVDVRNIRVDGEAVDSLLEMEDKLC